jgi:hypothetical protein
VGEGILSDDACGRETGCCVDDERIAKLRKCSPRYVHLLSWASRETALVASNAEGFP